MAIKKIIEVYPKDKIASRPPSICILGPAGSGKDMIAKHLSKLYGLIIISKLSVLWHEKEKDTTLSALAKAAIEKGD